MTAHRVDVHSHYLGEAAARWITSSGLHTNSGPLPSWNVDSTPAFMDRHATAAQVLSVAISFNANAHNAAQCETLCRELNEAYAAIIDAYPDRFGAFAAIPFTTPDAALSEITYVLDTLRLDGVLLLSNSGGQYLGQPSFEPIMAERSRRQIPALVHPVSCPHSDELGLGRPSFLFEFPVDTARAITHAIFRGVFQRHPGLQLVFAHSGGVLPTLSRRIADNAATVAAVLAQLYYETALAASTSSLVPTLQVTGSDHLLFGTDYPAAPEEHVTRNIANLLSFSGFDAEALRAVERDNAATLFPRLSAASNVR